MSLFKDLLTYKRVRLYDVAKHKQDLRLNVGHDYQSEGLLSRMVSKHILRNRTMRDFVIFIDDMLLNALKGVRYLRGFKNFTVKKDDKRIR